MIRQEERIRASFETRFANLNFDYNQTKRGQRIAANVAKLPGLLKFEMKFVLGIIEGPRLEAFKKRLTKQ
jgi:hypothetical protein